jgi:hypothetical protein
MEWKLRNAVPMAMKEIREAMGEVLVEAHQNGRR